MDLIFKCENELRNINNAISVRKRNKIIRKSNKCVINAISEIALNCLLGNIPLTKCKYQEIIKYKNILRKLKKKNISTKKKREIVIQRGGFLNLLIPPVLSLLAGVAANIINKKINKR